MSSTSAEGLTALSSTLLALSTVAIGLRFYIRHVQKLPLKMDDWITIPCLVSHIPLANGVGPNNVYRSSGVLANDVFSSI